MRNTGWILFLLVLIACKNSNDFTLKNENGGDVVFKIGENDRQMNRAIESAKESYPRFLEAFSKGDPADSCFAVKMKFPYGNNNFEHMWLSRLHFRDQTLTGILSSKPVNVKNIMQGDSVAVDTSALSDWMFVHKGRLKGGYTIKLLYRRANKADKQELKNRMPFEINE